jgi:hypothetical protein
MAVVVPPADMGWGCFRASVQDILDTELVGCCCSASEHRQGVSAGATGTWVASDSVQDTSSLIFTPALLSDTALSRLAKLVSWLTLSFQLLLFLYLKPKVNQ